MPGVERTATTTAAGGRRRRAGALLLAVSGAALLSVPLIEAAVVSLFGATAGGSPCWPSLCGVRALFAIPCPLCGGLRATTALARGEILAAVRWNPAAVLLHGILLASAGLLLFDRTPPWLEYGRQRAVLVAALSGLAANWAYLVADGR